MNNWEKAAIAAATGYGALIYGIVAYLPLAAFGLGFGSAVFGG